MLKEEKDPRILILDIDSTLIYANGNMDTFEKLKIHTDNTELRNRVYSFQLVDAVDPPGTGTTTPMWFIYRPYCKEFIEFALDYFDEVRVWSAGKYKYVHAIVNILFRETGVPDKIKTFDDCDYTEKGLFKPLKDYSHNLDNVLILDDRDDTFSLNPKNGIHIPAYEPFVVNKLEDDKDIALLQFACWLSIPHHRPPVKLTEMVKKGMFNTPISVYSNYLEGKLPFPVKPETYAEKMYRKMQSKPIQTKIL